MKKISEKTGLQAAGYESPRVCTCGINVRKMMCVSLYGGTEDMRMDGSVDPAENGGLENMGVETIDF